MRTIVMSYYYSERKSYALSSKEEKSFSIMRSYKKSKIKTKRLLGDIDI